MNHQLVIVWTKKGLSVHVQGCPGIGRKRAIPVTAEDIEEAKQNGHVVSYCTCTEQKP